MTFYSNKKYRIVARIDGFYVTGDEVDIPIKNIQEGKKIIKELEDSEG